ncbi:MAG: hypothetical protein ACRC57_11270 [Sarcina sp.]
MGIENFKNKLENNEVFNIYKKTIRISFINKDSSKFFSEFYNVKDKTELIEIIRKFIIPSSALTLLSEDNGEVIIILDENNTFKEFVNSLDSDDSIRLKIENSYKLVDLFELNEITIDTLLNDLSFELSENQITLISLEYAENIKSYLYNMYSEYEQNNNLDILEKELARINLCIGGFLDICENIDQYENDIKEKLLDKLPY